jgi:hypothetical protein
MPDLRLDAEALLFNAFCVMAPRVNGICNEFARKQHRDMLPPLQPCVHDALRSYWLQRILCVNQYHDVPSFVKGVFTMFDADSGDKRAALESLLFAMGVTSIGMLSDHPMLTTAANRQEFVVIMSDPEQFTAVVSEKGWLGTNAAAVLAPVGHRIAAVWQSVVAQAAASEAMLFKLWAGHEAQKLATPKKRGVSDVGGSGEVRQVQAKKLAVEPVVLSDDDGGGAGAEVQDGSDVVVGADRCGGDVLAGGWLDGRGLASTNVQTADARWKVCDEQSWKPRVNDQLVAMEGGPIYFVPRVEDDPSVSSQERKSQVKRPKRVITGFFSLKARNVGKSELFSQQPRAVRYKRDRPARGELLVTPIRLKWR